MKKIKQKILSKEEIAHIAHLACLSLSPKELDLYKEQLAATLEYVNMLENVDTKGITFPPQLTGLANILREDIVRSSLAQKDALSGAKKTFNGYFVVPAIFEE